MESNTDSYFRYLSTVIKETLLITANSQLYRTNAFLRESIKMPIQAISFIFLPS